MKFGKGDRGFYFWEIDRDFLIFTIFVHLIPLSEGPGIKLGWVTVPPYFIFSVPDLPFTVQNPFDLVFLPPLSACSSIPRLVLNLNPHVK